MHNRRLNMKFRWDRKYLYWGVTALAVICASMLFYFGIFHMDVLIRGFRILSNVMMPVIFGVVIAYLLTPVVNFLEKKFFFPLMKRKKIDINKKKKKAVRYISVFFALMFALLIIYSLMAMIVPSIVESIISIINDMPRYVQNVGHWLNSILKNNPELRSTAIDFFNSYSSKVETWMNVQLLPQLKEVLQQFTTGVFGALVFIKNFLIGAIISVYLMADKEGFLTQGKMFIYAVFDAERANDIIRGCRFVNKTFGGFVNGKIVDSAIIGVLCYILTSIIGTPYAILVSVIVGVTNVIPFFGPYLGAIPSAFIILLVNPMQCLYFLITILLLQQFDGNILGPKILGGSTGLSSFMVIVAILLFGGLFGIPGMIIGVPVWAVIVAGLKYLRNSWLKKKELPTDDKLYQEINFFNPDTLEPVKMKSEEEKEESEKKKRSFWNK